MDITFQKGEVVWAKVRGYSWWPGIIKKITLKSVIKENKERDNKKKREIKFLVKYIGDNSHSILPKDKLEKFQEKFSLYSKSKKKPLLHSIKLAKKLISGEITLLEINRNVRENRSEQSLKDLNCEGTSKEREEVK